MTFAHGIYERMSEKVNHFGTKNLCRAVYVKVHLLCY